MGRALGAPWRCDDPRRLRRGTLPQHRWHLGYILLKMPANRCAQAAIAPDGTPTMFGPGTMTPANRSDPHLLVWNQSFSKSFNQGPHGWSPEANSGIYMPLNERKSTNCNTRAVSGPKQSESAKNCVRSGRGLGHKRVQGTVECQPAGLPISDLLRQLHDGARPAACKRL